MRIRKLHRHTFLTARHVSVLLCLFISQSLGRHETSSMWAILCNKEQASLRKKGISCSAIDAWGDVASVKCDQLLNSPASKGLTVAGGRRWRHCLRRRPRWKDHLEDSNCRKVVRLLRQEPLKGDDHGGTDVVIRYRMAKVRTPSE